jgi:osmotically-inducible protein OsmY
MNIKRLVPGVVAAAMLLPGAFASEVFAAEPETARNSIDIQPADDNVPTGPSQNADDNKVTQQIWAALRADSTLSSDVKYLNIATNGEAVVLRGALPSAADKARVESLAGQYAGARQVDSQLTIIDY